MQIWDSATTCVVAFCAWHKQYAADQLQEIDVSELYV